MQNANPITVMIVEPNGFLRAGLKMSIKQESDIDVVGDLGTAAAAIAAAEQLAPDIMLISVTLPEMTGFESCIQVLDVIPGTRVIMMADQVNSPDMIASMMAGSAGFISKDVSKSDLVRTIRANGRGEMLLLAPVAERSLRFFQYNRRYVDVSPLTDREQQILVLAAAGLNNSDIGSKLSVSQHTVRNYISNIFSKLNISSRSELGTFAAVIGMMDVDEKDG